MFKPVSEVVSIFSWVVASIQVSAALRVQAGVVVDFGIVCLNRCLKVSIISGGCHVYPGLGGIVCSSRCCRRFWYCVFKAVS